MARIHLFEFGDLPWLPAVLRQGMTGYLQTLAARLPFFHPAIDKLNELLARTGQYRIVDLCSGAGGPVVALHAKLRGTSDQPLQILLTDRYPNRDAFVHAAAQSRGSIAFSAEP